jgi:hypothetical protein
MGPPSSRWVWRLRDKRNTGWDTPRELTKFDGVLMRTYRGRKLWLVPLIACALAAAFAVPLHSWTVGAGSPDGCIVEPGARPVIPQVTADPGSNEGHAQYAAAERTFWGFDATPGAIARAAGDPSATWDDLGTPLTRDESSKMDHFRQVARAVPLIDEETKGSSSYGGAYVDPADRAIIDVVLVHADCALLDHLRKDLPDQEVHGVKALNNVTADALSRKSNLLARSIRSLQAQEVFVASAGVSLPRNLFLVHLLPTAAPSSASVLAELLGSKGLKVAFDGKAAPAA